VYPDHDTATVVPSPASGISNPSPPSFKPEGPPPSKQSDLASGSSGTVGLVPAGEDGADSGTDSISKGRSKRMRKGDDKKTERVQKAILDLITPAERIIVAVEEAATSKYIMPQVIQAVDPKFQRTVFVHTKFQACFPLCILKRMHSSSM